MPNLFRALSRRLYALFTTHIALDFEQQFLAQQSDRKVELLRKAQELEEQGLTDLADELREQTERLSLERPLASVLPAAEHFHGGPLSIEESRGKGSSLEGAVGRPVASSGRDRTYGLSSPTGSGCFFFTHLQPKAPTYDQV